MPHQVFVGIAQYIVTLGAVIAEIQSRLLKYFNQVTQLFNLIFSLAQFLVVIEIGNCNYTVR